MKEIINILATISIALLTACNSANIDKGENKLQYAEQLFICDSENGEVVSIANPWKKNSILHEYILSETESTQYNYSSQTNTINIPLKRVIVMTNSHSKLLVELGLTDHIAGICELEYISDSTINARCKSGEITDCGNSLYPNIEKIIELNPDAILVSPFEDTGYGQLEKLGIPLIECADYMETSPLGRAEWCRFYGRLFGAAQTADTFFNNVETEYNELKKYVADNVTARPTVMIDPKGGSAWYIPGGKSTIGQMIADAGGDYIFSYDKSSGSVPMSFEMVYEKAHNADIWLLKNSTTHDLTYKSIAQDFSLYREFKPYQTKNIWVCDVYKVPYFECTSFHPEQLLDEYVSILHPELSTGYSRQWYHTIEAGE
jgi:iron complex transport system substrate-binding protein